LRVFYDGLIFRTQPHGGVARCFRELIPRLASRVDAVLSAVPGRKPLSGVTNLSHVCDLRLPEDVPMRSIPIAVNRFLSPLHGLSLRLQAGRCDVFHSTYYTEPFDRAPAVVTVHDMIHELFPDMFVGALNDRFRAIKRKCVESAAQVICVSHNTRNDVLRLYNLDPDRVSVIHHGSSKLPDVQRPPATVIDGSPFILYVGTRWGYKNFARLLEAWATWPHAKHVRLVCAGGERVPTDAELEVMRRMPMPRRVERLGKTADADLARLYRQAMCLVYPSIYEGFGLPVLEALASGAIVATSNTSSIPEVGGDAVTSFDPYDVDAIRAALDAALALQGAARAERIQRGLRRAAEFQWAAAADATLEVYRRALG